MGASRKGLPIWDRCVGTPLESSFLDQSKSQFKLYKTTGLISTFCIHFTGDAKARNSYYTERRDKQPNLKSNE